MYCSNQQEYKIVKLAGVSVIFYILLAGSALAILTGKLFLSEEITIFGSHFDLKNVVFTTSRMFYHMLQTLGYTR